jgi:hypothetical protein
MAVSEREQGILRELEQQPTAVLRRVLREISAHPVAPLAAPGLLGCAQPPAAPPGSS